MNKLLLFFFILMVNFCQAQWKDTFTDGNLSQNPTWYGDTSQFFINSQHQLQSKHQSKAASTYISTQSNLAQKISWEIKLKLDFKFAANNLLRIYLISDQKELNLGLNGYFILLSGNNSQYHYQLRKQTGTRSRTLFTSAYYPAQNQLSTTLKIERNDANEFSIYTKNETDTNFQWIGNVLDQQYTKSNYFGIYTRFSTASRSDKFYFDYFKVDLLAQYRIPPKITKYEIINQQSIQLYFSEMMDSLSLQLKNNYLWNKQMPDHITVQAQSVLLTFDEPFKTGKYQLKVQHLKDRWGNEIEAHTAFEYFYIAPYKAQFQDIVINEIMPNPKGQIHLPEKKYVEIWNRTEAYILLKDWQWADAKKTVRFPADTLKPNSYALLCAAIDTPLFNKYGKTIGFMNFPNLNNDKDSLLLLSPDNLLIDKLVYSDTWLTPSAKKRAGKSWERIHALQKCEVFFNWMESTDPKGGTPGKINAVFGLKKELLKIQKVSIVNAQLIEIQVNQSSVLKKSGLIFNQVLPNFDLIAIQKDSSFVHQLKFATELPTGIKFKLQILKISNCDSFLENETFNLFIAKKPRENQILISEILTHPRKGGGDFIEIYNPTDEIFNLKDLLIANRDQKGNPIAMRNISKTDYWILPKKYTVITSNKAFLLQNYWVAFPSQVVEMVHLPAFANEEGCVWILCDQQTIDLYAYHVSAHHPLLKSTQGVSLERISFSKACTNANFNSALAENGFATPTFENAHKQRAFPKNKVYLKNKTVSANLDGFEDLLEINYELEASNWILNVSIYTDQGILVKNLIKNQAISQKGALFWDTLNNRAHKSPQGIYVLLFQIHNLEGKTWSKKLSFAVVNQ